MAQKAWAARTAKDRSTVLRRWFDLMMANQDDLGRILTAEQGKPLASNWKTDKANWKNLLFPELSLSGHNV